MSQENQSLESIFMKLATFNDSGQQELIFQQEKLQKMLAEIQNELQQLIESTTFEKDKQYLQQFERIQIYKKRLELINSKMTKVQGRVDGIEKRFIKVQKDHQILLNQEQQQ